MEQKNQNPQGSPPHAPVQPTAITTTVHETKITPTAAQSTATKLTVTAENGEVVFTREDGKEKRYAIQPFESFFQTVSNALSDVVNLYSDEPKMLLHYNGCTYRWCLTLAHYTFGKGRMSEAEFADATLVSPKEGEE